MIPRRVRPVEEAEVDIPTRLAHLRAEQRNRPRAILTSSTTSNSPSRTTAFLLSDLQPVARSTPVVGLPPSWAPSFKSHRSDSLSSKLNFQRRRRLLCPLDSTATPPRLPTLSDSILRLIARDLREDSIYRNHLGWIPAHVRIRLLDVAAVWAPLNEISVLAILAIDQRVGGTMENGEAKGGMQRAGSTTVEGGEVEGMIRREDEEGWEEQHDRIDFHSLSSPTTYPFFLTSLNLSFSQITSEALKQLLIAPTPPTPTRASSISLFPHLTTLQLARMPNLPLSQPLYDILSSLLRLQHLNLAGNVPAPRISYKSTTIISRLALATPHLISIDLSEMNWVDELPGTIDLTIEWKDLKRMGFREYISDDPMIRRRTVRRSRVDAEDSMVRRMRRTRWIEIIES